MCQLCGLLSGLPQGDLRSGSPHPLPKTCRVWIFADLVGRKWNFVILGVFGGAPGPAPRVLGKGCTPELHPSPRRLGLQSKAHSGRLKKPPVSPSPCADSFTFQGSTGVCKGSGPRSSPDSSPCFLLPFVLAFCSTVRGSEQAVLFFVFFLVCVHTRLCRLFPVEMLGFCAVHL